MRHTLPRRLLALATTATAFVAVWGCDSGAPPAESSKTPATVSGTVTIKGKPASTGKVTFNPANINRRDASSVTGDIGKDGSYKVTTLVGENTVIVDTPEVRKNSGELRNGQTSFNASAGDNSFNIELPPK